MSPKYLKLIKNRQWYHQGFDGSPMFLFAVGEAETLIEPRKPKGTEANVRVCFFSHGRADWYLDVADIRQGAQALVKLAKKNPKISTQLLASWKKDEAEFEKFFWEEFPKINLRRLNDGELLELWQRYYRLFVKRFTSSSLIDHFALGTDELIGQMLRREIGALPKESDFTQIFAIATAPVHLSFINQAEVDLLKIILRKSRLSLSEYQKRYFWLKNNYVVSQILTSAHFQKEIQSWKRSRKNLALELKRITETPQLNRKKKSQLFRKYKLSRLLRTLIKISEDFTWWQDERKKSTYLNIHIGTQILGEVAKRTVYEVEELKYAVASEISGILQSHQPSRHALRARMEASVFVMTRLGYGISTGKAVITLRRLMLGNQRLAGVQDIRGLTASPGRAIGRVKVLKSATEVNKLEPGDILVAVMTRPDYVTAMKRAAAIVTNEGGITSHAAIVSRELSIPCIIGTKIATEVFHDGEMVEVNANHGWVRKLS